ncbi:MAG TPA: response regulator [Opitutaceae bacterium]|jgi:CheY-like chemotaxis protein|nr:response regulator [Opitutaceae bacterium]
MSQAEPAKAKWILVIDDQPMIRDILERFLQMDGYFVSTAAGAAEGMDRARSLPIDLVVLDLDLPWSSGLTARAELRSDPALAHLPLLLISSRLSKRDLQKMATAGVDGFLTMPFSLAEVRETVSRLLGPAGELVSPA